MIRNGPKSRVLTFSNGQGAIAGYKLFLSTPDFCDHAFAQRIVQPDFFHKRTME
jgi:hypothetical protein